MAEFVLQAVKSAPASAVGAALTVMLAVWEYPKSQV